MTHEPRNEVRQVWADRRAQPLRRVLWQWLSILDHLVADWKGYDVPWWYNERALVGTVAAAIWKAGGSAFEEFSALKGIPAQGEGKGDQ